MSEKRNINSETRSFELRMQADAVTRAVSLLGKDREWFLNDVLQKLADAERKSGFLCGFVDLAASNELEKEELLHYLVQQDLIVLNDNEPFKLSLNGEKRSSAPLPPQIESELR